MSGIIAAAGPRGIFLDSARPGRWDGGTRPTVSHLPIPPSPPPGEVRPMSNAPDQAPTNRPAGGAETPPPPPPAPRPPPPGPERAGRPRRGDDVPARARLRNPRRGGARRHGRRLQ